MSSFDRKRRQTAALAAASMLGVGLSLSVGARAQGTQRSFTVISEMARELSFVTHQQQTGSRLDANQRQRLPVANGIVDRLALTSSRSAIQKVLPGSRVSLVAPLAEDLLPGLAAVDVGGLVNMPTDLVDVLREHGSRELLVWSRLRSEARIRFKDSVNAGQGQLEGLGLYVDRTTPVLDLASNQTTMGYIAPYFYARATLVDVSSKRVLRAQRVEQAEVFVNVRNDTRNADAWNALTDDEKLREMSELMVREINAAIPSLLAPG